MYYAYLSIDGIIILYKCPHCQESLFVTQDFSLLYIKNTLYSTEQVYNYKSEHLPIFYCPAVMFRSYYFNVLLRKLFLMIVF